MVHIKCFFSYSEVEINLITYSVFLSRKLMDCMLLLSIKINTGSFIIKKSFKFTFCYFNENL